MVWLVLGPHHGDSHTQGSRCGGVLPRMARVSQERPWVSRETPWVFREWPWVSRWGGASVGASPKVSRGGEASDGASSCESRGQIRGVPGW